MIETEMVEVFKAGASKLISVERAAALIEDGVTISRLVGRRILHGI